MYNESMKTCTQCHREYPTSEFYVDSRKKDGLYSVCKGCHLSKARRGYIEKRGLEKMRDRHLRNTYRNFSSADYAVLYQQEGGRCAICGQEETKRHRNGAIHALSVDHDHQTGLVRQLLCSDCNHVIAFCREDVARLVAAIEYLKRHADADHADAE